MPLELQSTDALFLDIDGTLLDIAPHPDLVVVPRGLVLLLELLRRRLDGGLAILSGRPVSQIDKLFAPIRFVSAGEHGSVVRLTPGGTIDRLSQPLPSDLTIQVRAIAAEAKAAPVEVKTSAIAVHFRNAPHAEAMLAERLKALLTSYPDWTVMRGRRAFDITSTSTSKGTTLQLLSRSPAFQGRRPVMIGDDVTDLSAIAMAASLGGAGLTVASNVFSTDTAHFQHPAAVRAWLGKAAARLSDSVAHRDQSGRAQC